VSEKRHRDLVENSQGFICIHDLDGNLLSVNPAAAQSLGYTPDEMADDAPLLRQLPGAHRGGAGR